MPNPSVTNFNPVEFYNLASWLFQTRPSLSEQSLKRTIIGRAYYAALLSGSKKTGTSTRGLDSHNLIVDAVQKINSQAANNLRTMKKRRKEADYEFSLVNERDVQLSLRESRVVLELLGFISPSDPKQTKDYLDKSKFFTP